MDARGTKIITTSFPYFFLPHLTTQNFPLLHHLTVNLSCKGLAFSLPPPCKVGATSLGGNKMKDIITFSILKTNTLPYFLMVENVSSILAFIDGFGEREDRQVVVMGW